MTERTTKFNGSKRVTLKQTFNCGDKKNDKNKYVYHRYGPSNQQATIAAFERVLDMKQRELDLERQTCAVRVAEFENLIKMQQRRPVDANNQDTQDANGRKRPNRGDNPNRQQPPAVHPRRPVTANNQDTQDANGRKRPNRGDNSNKQQLPAVHPRRPVTANNRQFERWNLEINNYNEQQNRVDTLPKRIPKNTEKKKQYNEARAGKKKTS
jgi:hypothetical protein